MVSTSRRCSAEIWSPLSVSLIKSSMRSTSAFALALSAGDDGDDDDDDDGMSSSSRGGTVVFELVVQVLIVLRFGGDATVAVAGMEERKRPLPAVKKWGLLIWDTVGVGLGGPGCTAAAREAAVDDIGFTIFVINKTKCLFLEFTSYLCASVFEGNYQSFNFANTDQNRAIETKKMIFKIMD